MGNILAPLKKFASNKNTVTILGVLLGVVVLFLGYQWRVNSAISPVNIYYATRTLVQGDVITAEDVGETQISSTILNSMDNVVQTLDCGDDYSQNCIVGKMVSFDSKIPRNSYFFEDSMISPDEMPDSLFSNIPNGYTIFALEIDNMTSYGNSIFPDDNIDLYLHAKDDNSDGKDVYGKFIESIKVLAVKDDKGNNVFKNREEIREPSVLLFSVPEDYYLLLSKAVYVGMEIVPVPRNASYTTNPGETNVASEWLKSFVLAKTVDIPDEEVETN